MDIRFIAHRDYLDNKKNLSCRLLKGVLEDTLGRYLDILEYVDDIDDMDDIISSDSFSLSHIVPIGDLNFVRDYLNKLADKGYDVADKDLTPLEIPKSLTQFVGRGYRIKKGADMTSDEMIGRSFFVKDIDTLKRWNSLLYEGDLSEFIESDTTYSISEKVNFLSEWRVFVHRGEMKGAFNYLGEPVMFPDREALYDMVRAYEQGEAHPSAYTLDVGIISKGDRLLTVPIEVHPFVACGLYGFSDMCIPRMLEDGYKWYLSGADQKNDRAGE